MKTQRWLAVAALLGLAASFWPLGAAASPAAQAGNLVLNGGFEDAGTASTATSWQPWWQESPKPSDGSLNYAYRPSWNVEKRSSGAAAELVFAGNNSQRVINNWDPWFAGVKQVVFAPAGARVRLTVNARVWASADNWPTASDTSVPVRVQVGLEPNGSSDQFAGSVVWSNAITPHNTWQSVSVETTVGSGGRVGVFLSADYRGSSRLFLAAFFDEASLVVVSSGTPVPGATNTPSPTPTATVTGTPPPTSTPTATGIPPTATGVPATYVVKAGDTLGAIARRFGVSVAVLAAANNIRNLDRIFVGQVLVIRGGTSGAPSTGVVIYLVQRGDTLSRLGRRFGVTVAQLKAWNSLRSDLIFVGQRLIVGP